MSVDVSTGFPPSLHSFRTFRSVPSSLQFSRMIIHIRSTISYFQQPKENVPGGPVSGEQMAPGRGRHTIWQGVLEWLEEAKNRTDTQKLTRHVPCQVSANSKDGEPEVNADSWPQKLIMQLVPKQLIGNIGGAYLKNSKSVLFHPTACEALEDLTKVISPGFAGCVHFTSVPSSAASDIKVLILLYTAEKRAYVGFIPNDQAAFLDRLRKVTQHQETTQALIKQEQETPEQEHRDPGEGVGTSNCLEKAGHVNEQQIRILQQGLKEAKLKEANLRVALDSAQLALQSAQLALQSAQLEVTDIQQSLESAQEMEKQYKRRRTD